jgi:hypothetical protein
MNNESMISSNESPFQLEYSIDFGQTWTSIDRPSTIASNLNDIVIRQPLMSLDHTFYLPLHVYYSEAKYVGYERWDLTKKQQQT